MQLRKLSTLLVLLFGVLAILGSIRAEETEATTETQENIVVDSAEGDFTTADPATLESDNFEFQAEINKLMGILVNSLYSNRDVFLRELISNSADALDKIRFLSVTDKTILDSAPELDIRIKIDKENNALHIRDTGIGMTRDDLINNLGRIARSGTKEFLEQAGKGDLTQIGQFGVGFYSAFLVADRVTVTTKHNDDKQYVWESSANEQSSFTIGEDPRGNTLGRGTLITLHLKDDALDYLEPTYIQKLAKTYNEFTHFPILLWNQHEETVEVEDTSDSSKDKESDDDDEEESIDLDSVKDLDDDVEEEEKPVKTKTVTRTVWGWVET